MGNIQIKIGKDEKGNTIVKDLENILVCGSTRSGKSVFLHSVIDTILKDKSPEEVKLVLIDTKKSEFDIYKDIPHLIYPVINDSKEAVTKLFEFTTKTVMKRHRMFRDDDGWNSLEEYNKKYEKEIPYIIVVIDEFSDIINEYHGQKSLEHLISLAKNVGVEVLLSTSICSENIITEYIKNYIQIKMVGFLPEDESKYILGSKKAKELNGNGDMIFIDGRKNETTRVKTPYISTEAIKKNVKRVNKLFTLEEGDVVILERCYSEWLTYEEITKLFKGSTIMKIKGMELYPLFIYPIDNNVSMFSSLILGILDSYDTSSSEIYRLEDEYGININDQEKYYKKFLLKQLGAKEEYELEDEVLHTLSNLKDCSDIDFVIPFYRNLTKLFTSSFIIWQYILVEIDYLYEYPENRNEDIYKRLRGLFKMVKKEEITENGWENLVVIDYCLADILGEDRDKNKYIKGIKNEDMLRALRERTCFDILFGEEYI